MIAFEPRLLAYLANSLWQIPLLLLAGWIAARLVRHAGPAAEHRIWMATLFLQLTVPLLATFSWQPLWARLTALFASQSTGSAHVSIFFGPGMAVSPARLSDSFLAIFFAAYFLACAWFVARFLWRSARLRTLRRSARPLALSADAAQIFAQCCRRFHLPGVSLRSSSRIAGPIALGIRHPLILLPEAMAADLERADLETILAHELAHLRRRDFLTNLLCEGIALPIGWHPAIWLTRQRIAETRELACDRMAAEVTGATPYAQSLLRLASRLVPRASLATPHALGIFDTAVFERRLMRLTEIPTPLNRAARAVMLAACAALALATCGSALALGMHPAAPAAAAAGHAKAAPTPVPSGAMAGNRISGAVPIYPPDAKKAHIQGTVVLHATISKKGNVEHLEVVSGPPALQQSSLDAVRTWRYKPYLLNGKAVAVITDINIVYSLGDDSAKTPPPPPPPAPQEKK
ncbi:MAG: M56 family metallopeptidase [Acidobacteriaceae bacterium]